MSFAFTDEEVANALAHAAVRHSSMTIRVLADWSQRIRARGQQVDRLAKLGLPNLCVRYKNDQPYTWDAAAEKVRWSYRASRGLLHHKTLSVLLDGRPWKLICGSFNWTRNATNSYENLLVVTAEQAGSRQLMSRIELEFEAMWSDGRATLSPEEAHLHYQAILDAYRRDPTISPAAVVGLARGRGEPLQILDPECYPPEHEGANMDNCDEQIGSDVPRVSVAFSSRRPDQDSGQCGYAEPNRTQRFLLRKPSAKSKRVPLTLTTLALDTIFRAEPGDTLKIAMYGLSTRVPEYGALLEAARRGVRLFVLLDGSVGADVVGRLVIARHLEDLPIEVRTGCKMMHQKYVVHPNSATVLTGTANMTTDASDRHSEQRIVVRGCSALAEQFCADFHTIWARLST
jgi:phosphatidylserine/phosphatidylglycerophosphate/cardiolipin synthase-like enzyme